MQSLTVTPDEVNTNGNGYKALLIQNRNRGSVVKGISEREEISRLYGPRRKPMTIWIPWCSMLTGSLNSDTSSRVCVDLRPIPLSWRGIPINSGTYSPTHHQQELMAAFRTPIVYHSRAYTPLTTQLPRFFHLKYPSPVSSVCTESAYTPPLSASPTTQDGIQQLRNSELQHNTPHDVVTLFANHCPMKPRAP